MLGGQAPKRPSDPRYREAVADTAEDFLFHLYRGSELLQDNRVHEAKEELEQALKLQPRDAKGQDLLAVVYFRLGLYPRAIEIYEELVRAFAGDPALLQNLALCYLKTGQADKARNLLEPLVMAQPSHLRAWGYLGLAYERLGDYDKARAAFERAEQPGMARRMVDLITASIPPRSLSVPPDARTLPTFSELEPVAPPLQSAHSSAPNGIAAAFASFGPLSVEGAAPAAGPGASSGAAAPTSSPRPEAAEVPSIAELARQRGIAFPREPGAAQHPSGLVLVQVESSFAARGSAVRAMRSDGEGFRTAPLLRRTRARHLEEPLGAPEDAVVLLSGWGYLVLAARDDYKLVTIRLDDEGIYLHEHALIGFDGALSYESGRLAGNDTRNTPLVQLRGRGVVVFEACQSFGCLDVTTTLAATVAEPAILGWTGRLVPREMPASEAPTRATRLIAFEGDGTVFLATGPTRDLAARSGAP